MIKIPPQDLVCMNEYESTHPLKIDLAYAQSDNLLFGEAIYKADACLYVHKILALVLLSAAEQVFETHGYTLIIHDGLRTTDAQARMLETGRVKDNPQWLQEPRLLSPPGAGGHPRGMAVDVSVADSNGTLLDMGTPFDFLAKDPSAEKNPAHREYKDLSEGVRTHRNILDMAMKDAADAHGVKLLPLPQEWWDFRLYPQEYEQYAPLSDDDLPEEMRLVI